MADVSPPRLCHLRIWPGYDGYGFTVDQSEKVGQTGHFIAKIEPGSPAQAGGLKDGDKIVEINGAVVDGFAHKNVLAKIKSKKKEFNILVVDKQCQNYYEENNISITGSVSSVLHCSSENVLSLVEKTGKRRKEGEIPLVESMAEVIKQHPRKKKVESAIEEDIGEIDNNLSDAESSSSHVELDDSVIVRPEDLDLNMSAKEMRERLSKNKKKDGRLDVTVDVKKRVQAIQDF